MTLAEMLDKLERGRIGHTEAMRWLGVNSYNELVEIVHYNGRQMPGHRPNASAAGNPKSLATNHTAALGCAEAITATTGLRAAPTPA